MVSKTGGKERCDYCRFYTTKDCRLFSGGENCNVIMSGVDWHGYDYQHSTKSERVITDTKLRKLRYDNH